MEFFGIGNEDEDETWYKTRNPEKGFEKYRKQ
jgi:hypothetical protein